MFLQFNRRSGLLMFVAPSEKKPVKYFVNDQWVELLDGDTHVLFQRINRLRFSRHDYDLLYTLPQEPATLGKFHGIRDTYLKTHFSYRPLSQREVPGIPPRCGFQKIHNILIFNTAASGGFGWVCNGVDVTTGDPVAIKELRVKSKHEIQPTIHELRAGRDFQISARQNYRGLGRLLIPTRTYLVFYRQYKHGANNIILNLVGRYQNGCFLSLRLEAKISKHRIGVM